ncbi:hypothetical protein [Rhizobium halophytocola]|uniref:Uncharacterized protein n=1 Tax=Rhizobium halophytocola TaxID=735519 RepID=A0ABS4E433_9HYPH|nr:hypothetical protein [Rhizobium halophytocola]MBP1852710.1 hypothetical protein [Rhizobium halophytocola]
MTRLMIPVEIPVEVIADALAPDIARALQQREGDKTTKKHRAPSQSLVEAARILADALTRFEDSEGTRDEQRARANLKAAASGVRKAYRNFTKPIRGPQS